MPLLDRLQAYVKPGAVSVSTADQAYLEACLAEAQYLVDKFAGVTYSGDIWSGVWDDVWATRVTTVPGSILERAYIEVASELYNRQSAPNGISQFASPDGSPIRIRRDPMTAVYDMLRPFIAGGFA